MGSKWLLNRAPLLLLIVTLSSCQLLQEYRSARGEEGAEADPDPSGSLSTRPVASAADVLELIEYPGETDPDSVRSHEVGSEPPLEELAGGVDATEVAAPRQHADAQEADEGASLWARLRAGFQLDLSVEDRRIEQEINWYRNNQEYLDRVAARAERYLYFIVEEAAQRGLPTELALLPIVESAYDPFAYSHSRAMGLWQFIPATGALYGLRRDWWYDGRRDIRASTHAALDYLEDLYAAFDGDWPLALAAYNSGAGNVRSAIKRNMRLGRATDFWSLRLLRETSAYVPRLYAIARLVADPAAYGIELAPIQDAPYFAVIDVGSQIDLTLAAELAEISVSELYLLNPGFNRWASHPDGPHELLVPNGQADLFERNLASLDQAERVGWLRHRIREGESLGTIAGRYRTTVATLKRINGLRGDLIRSGDSLMVPTALESSERYTLSDDQRRTSAERYYTRKHGSEPIIHHVVAGDNLWDLARTYGVSFRALARWNGIATTDLLRVGQELRVWTDDPMILAEHRAIAAAQRPEVIRKVNYRVRKGESLSLIASKFNLTVSDIKEWNRSLEGRRYIQPGDRLTLYVDVIEGGE